MWTVIWWKTHQHTINILTRLRDHIYDNGKHLIPKAKLNMAQLKHYLIAFYGLLNNVSLRPENYKNTCKMIYFVPETHGDRTFNALYVYTPVNPMIKWCLIAYSSTYHYLNKIWQRSLAHICVCPKPSSQPLLQYSTLDTWKETTVIFGFIKIDFRLRNLICKVPHEQWAMLCIGLLRTNHSRSAPQTLI